MAINFVRIKPLKVAEGDLPTGAAAYISRSSMRSGVTGERFRFQSRRKDLAYTNVMLPTGVDSSFKDPEHLWSAMERAEIVKEPRRKGELKLTKKEFQALLDRIDDPAKKRLSKKELAPAWREDAQLAYHIVLACPHEFTEEQIVALVRAFVEQELLVHGFIVQIAVHRPDESSPLNWHAHLLVATREVSGAQVGNKIRDVFAGFANKKGGGGFVSDNGGWPDRWAAFQLDYARRIGVNISLPEKAAIPEPHIGKAFHLPESDLVAARAAANAESRDAIQQPGVLADLLSESRTSFTEDDARSVLARHRVSGEASDYQIATLQDSSELLPLFDRRDGRFSGRFTTEATRNQEMRIREIGTALAAQIPGDPRQLRLSQKAGALARRLRQPKRKNLQKLLLDLANPTGFSIVDASGIAGSAFLALHRLDKGLESQFVHLAPQPTGLGQFRDRVTTIGRALRRQNKGTDSAWNRGTLLLVHEADQLDAVLADCLLRRAAETGARLVLLSHPERRHAPGRNGAVTILDDLFMPRLEPEVGETNEADDWPDLIRFPPDDLRQSTLAWAAPGDRRPRKVPRMARLTQPEAPRPWRWPGASLGDVLNLSCRADCDHIFQRLTKLPADAAFAIYRDLPGIADPADKPSSHPLAVLRRSLRGRFRKAGFDPVRGGVDRDPFKFLQPTNDDNMWHRTDLAPRAGKVDVRKLLAGIDSIDLKDWEEIADIARHFSKPAFEAIRDGLHDLSKRTAGDGVRHAISLALAQIYILAKDAGQDLQPDIPRDEIWSMVPAAEMVQKALRYDDHDSAIRLSHALALSSFLALNPQVRREQPALVNKTHPEDGASEAPVLNIPRVPQLKPAPAAAASLSAHSASAALEPEPLWKPQLRLQKEREAKRLKLEEQLAYIKLKLKAATGDARAALITEQAGITVRLDMLSRDIGKAGFSPVSGDPMRLLSGQATGIQEPMLSDRPTSSLLKEAPHHLAHDRTQPMPAAGKKTTAGNIGREQ